MLRYSRAFLLSVRRPVFAYLTILSLSLIGLSSGVFYGFEKNANPKVASLFDALYFVVGVMTGGGSGDIYPVTLGGRTFAMGLMLLGTVILVSYMALLAAVLVELDLGEDPEKPSA